MTRTLAAFLFVLPAAFSAQDTRIVSVDDAGIPGDLTSGSEGIAVAVDAAGNRLVFFCSYATNLVAGDTNGVKDVFLRDVTAGTTTRVVMGAGGVEPDGDMINLKVTSGGEFLVFASYATNLVAGDTNGEPDVFLLDRTTGGIELVSTDLSGGPSDDGSYGPSVTEDGRYVAFTSYATDLVKPGVDTNGNEDVFVRDRKAGTTSCASVSASGIAGNGASSAPFFRNAIRSDGGTLLFSSAASDLVKADGNGVLDAFVRDLSKGTTTRISLDENGNELATGGRALALSRKGSVAIFRSDDPAVLAGFSNGLMQVYASLLFTGELLPGAARADGSPLQTDHSFIEAGIAGDDGSDFDPIVAFVTPEDDVVPGELDSSYDAFVRTLRGGVVQQASVDSNGADALFGDAFLPVVAPDGTCVAFHTSAALEMPPDLGIVYDVYLRGLCWTRFVEFGVGLGGSRGYVPHFTGLGGSCEDLDYSLHLTDGLGGAFGLLWAGLGTADQDLFGGHFYVDFGDTFFTIPFFLAGKAGVPGDGTLDLDGANCESLVGLTIYLQCMVVDPGAVKRIAMSNALELGIE